MRPFLDLVSYARHGPGRRDHFSRAELEIIARTVSRAPEVMVKVLTRGGQNLAAAGRHLDYLDREGELPIVTDDGQELKGKGIGKDLLLNWDLDLEEDRPTMTLEARPKEKPPKLVHKVLFSMPAGTPPKKVLAAVKAFAREEFGAKHRYAMVLHTDEPHPHVHMVVKAMSEQGQRLNIRKATLRHWRQQFARQLREQGVAANATERAARGVTKPRKLDGIHRAAMRGVSTHWRQRAEAVARELAAGGIKAEPGKARLLETRRRVTRGWEQVAEELIAQGQRELALAVGRFVERMPVPRTEKEFIKARLLEARQKAGSRADHQEMHC
jgi:hypothetical protein